MHRLAGRADPGGRRTTSSSARACAASASPAASPGIRSAPASPPATACGSLYGVRYTDMCAFRAIRRDALLALGMREMTYGWNIEMQMRAARAGLRILEIPVPCRCRIGGTSKVAGSLARLDPRRRADRRDLRAGRGASQVGTGGLMNKHRHNGHTFLVPKPANPDGLAPLLQRSDHAAPSIFRPENMLREARRQKGIGAAPVAPVCVIDPDGDIVDHVRRHHGARASAQWACYHTRMWEWTAGGIHYGIVGRAVGGSFSVLVAEQLFASGCKLLLSVASAGQITDIAPAAIPHPDRAGAAGRGDQLSLSAADDVCRGRPCADCDSRPRPWCAPDAPFMSATPGPRTRRSGRPHTASRHVATRGSWRWKWRRRRSMRLVPRAGAR